MRGTAIELSNLQNTGWAQNQTASAILEITYPSSDVRRALEAVSTSLTGKSVVMIGQRGSGKSHIMATDFPVKLVETASSALRTSELG